MWLSKTLKRLATDLFTRKPAWNQQKHSKVAAELNVCCPFVQQIAKHDLRLMPCLSTGHLGCNHTEMPWTLPNTSLMFAKDSYKEGVIHWRKELLSDSSCKKIRTTLFGLLGRSVRWMRIAFWFKEPSLHHTSWHLLQRWTIAFHTREGEG